MEYLDYKKVLIVDDEEDLLEIISFEFEDLGFEIKTAKNGEEALEVLKDFPAFLIFSDINMPEMDGVELLERVNKFKNRKPYVVLCSGFSGYEKEQLLKKGAFDFCSKPFEFSYINDLIKKLDLNDVG